MGLSLYILWRHSGVYSLRCVIVYISYTPHDLLSRLMSHVEMYSAAQCRRGKRKRAAQSRRPPPLTSSSTMDAHDGEGPDEEVARWRCEMAAAAITDTVATSIAGTHRLRKRAVRKPARWRPPMPTLAASIRRLPWTRHAGKQRRVEVRDTPGSPPLAVL